MFLKLLRNKPIAEVCDQFNSYYPFLRLDFYKPGQGNSRMKKNQKLSTNSIMESTGISEEGEIEISDEMTVRQLEEIFFEEHGIIVQVARKSGNIWLETSISDNWTLLQQNGHGKEISDQYLNNRYPGL